VAGPFLGERSLVGAGIAGRGAPRRIGPRPYPTSGPDPVRPEPEGKSGDLASPPGLEDLGVVVGLVGSKPDPRFVDPAGE
jgi:hypothetical protein